MIPGMVMAESEQRDEAGQDAWLTAMAHYFSLDWTGLEHTTLPTLLVRAREPMPGSPPKGDWKPSWAYSSDLTVVDVPGDHFTIMAAHAETTTQAVSEWLAAFTQR